MSRILSRSRPAIVVECNADRPYREIQHRLDTQSYMFYHLTLRGPERKQSLMPDETERYRNYLCLPLERSEQFDPARACGIAH
jgi:hypothetical protein